MANGHARQDALLQVDGGVRHPPTEAGGAESALFAGEGDELGVAALATDQMQTPVLETPAAKVLLELLGDDTPPELALDEPGLAACYAAAAKGLSVASAARGRAGGSGEEMSRSGAFPACSAGVMVNKRPQVRVSLTVEPSGAPTFVSQWTWVFSVSDTQTYKVGAKVKVYFDPADRGHVAVVSLAQ